MIGALTGRVDVLKMSEVCIVRGEIESELKPHHDEAVVRAVIDGEAVTFAADNSLGFCGDAGAKGIFIKCQDGRFEIVQLEVPVLAET